METLHSHYAQLLGIDESWKVEAVIRHYHVHISPPPHVTLKGYGHAADVDIAEYFHAVS